MGRGRSKVKVQEVPVQVTSVLREKGWGWGKAWGNREAPFTFSDPHLVLMLHGLANISMEGPGRTNISMSCPAGLLHSLVGQEHHGVGSVLHCVPGA